MLAAERIDRRMKVDYFFLREDRAIISETNRVELIEGSSHLASMVPCYATTAVKLTLELESPWIGLDAFASNYKSLCQPRSMYGTNNYRVTHQVSDPGWVDFDLDVQPILPSCSAYSAYLSPAKTVRQTEE